MGCGCLLVILIVVGVIGAYFVYSVAADSTMETEAERTRVLAEILDVQVPPGYTAVLGRRLDFIGWTYILLGPRDWQPSRGRWPDEPLISVFAQESGDPQTLRDVSFLLDAWLMPSPPPQALGRRTRIEAGGRQFNAMVSNWQSEEGQSIEIYRIALSENVLLTIAGLEGSITDPMLQRLLSSLSAPWLPEQGEVP